MKFVRLIDRDLGVLITVDQQQRRIVDVDVKADDSPCGAKIAVRSVNNRNRESLLEPFSDRVKCRFAAGPGDRRGQRDRLGTHRDTVLRVATGLNAPNRSQRFHPLGRQSFSRRIIVEQHRL